MPKDYYTVNSRLTSTNPIKTGDESGDKSWMNEERTGLLYMVLHHNIYITFAK